MSDLQQLTLAEPAHRNQYLFSDHFLNENLPARPQWTALQEEARPVMECVAAILAEYVTSDNERQTEEDLVMPVLRLLGHTFEVQPSLRTAEGAKTPDYVFYRDAESQAANRGQMLTDQLPSQGGIAVGDAKYWNRPLDTAIRQSTTDALSNKNPNYQIYFYMLHSGVTWGILTNGRLWRLYHKDTAHKLDHFYEVDLQALVESGDPARFVYFYAFFRRAAFDDGPLSLANILRESADYARSVGDSLKLQVYDALRHLAQGFLDYPPNNLRPDEHSLAAIYDSSLIVLYRLIFILYAEARELLPVRENSQYREIYSLHAMKRGVARDIDSGRLPLPTTACLWPRLEELFEAINLGSPPLHVATFNGGLFDPGRHEFLTRCAVGDYHLQQAIDKLTRVDRAFVDYGDLSVRHMGTIYEGLLEYRLRSLDHPEEGWAVELVNDKGERKATGSYYTPDYIVKYIVEQAVGPVLQSAIQGKATDEEKLKAILSVNVLDPAMGSGHFLVETVEFIARFIVDLAIAPEGKTAEEADLAFWKRRVVQSCVYGVDLNPLAVELAKLSLWLTTVANDRPLSFLDHHLRPGNSLVGARLEHLQLPAPRRRSGRARQADRAEEAGQITLFADSAFTQRVSTAVGSMWMIETSEAESVEQVKEQERLYESLRAALIGRYSRLLDLVVAADFGLDIPGWLRESLITYLTKGNGASFPQFDALLAQADEIARRERFFHWELEFPEVYFDEHGRPLGDEGGFEAVVGNPPYVEQERLVAYKPYFQQRFEVFHGVADLYLYFYEQGLHLARRGGRLAYVSSGTFARANFASTFRRWLPTVAQIESFIDFGENQPFAGAEMVRPSITVMRKVPQTGGFRSLFIDGRIPASLDVALADRGVDCDTSTLEQREWTFQGCEITRLARKVLSQGPTLRDVVGGRMYRGVLTGLNEAFIIDQRTRDSLVAADPHCSEIIKPVLCGEDLRPWYQENEGRWLIALPCGWTRATFAGSPDEGEAWGLLGQLHPSLAHHLAPFADAARVRCDKGEYWWELRPCDYYDAFEQPKLFWPDISKLPRFSLGGPGVYISNTGYVVPSPPPCLLPLMQSRVLWFAISQICQPLRLRAGLWQYRLLPQFMPRLPIPHMADEESELLASLAERATALARARYSLHCRVRHRVHTDLGTPEKRLNQKLTNWWELDFPALRREVQKVFRTDIPVAERDQWEAWFADQLAEHRTLTDGIIHAEEEINDRVYALFGLTPDEIRLIEESTRYRFGEV